MEVKVMNRPYIFGHMMTSLDGKIMGKYVETPEGAAAGDVFYNISFGKNPHYKHQGWLSGRITTDDNFTFYEKPELNEEAAKVPEGDYIAKKTDIYYVSIDPSGRLGWKSSTLTYIDTTAHVIEVLTEKATNAYKDFLRRRGISLNSLLPMPKFKSGRNRLQNSTFSGTDQVIGNIHFRVS